LGKVGEGFASNKMPRKIFFAKTNKIYLEFLGWQKQANLPQPSPYSGSEILLRLDWIGAEILSRVRFRGERRGVPADRR
jgi:hypothetical protein